MKRFTLLSMPVLMSGGVLSAGGQSDSGDPLSIPHVEFEDIEGYPRTVADILGRELTFDAPPERVVTLYTTNYGAPAALGIRPVGQLTSQDQLGDGTYFFEDGASIPAVNSVGFDIDLELVAVLEPDLILAFSREEANRMSGIAPAFLSEGTYAVEDGLASLAFQLRKLGRVFDREAEAEAAVRRFEDRFAAYRLLAPEERPSVVRIGVSNDGNVFPLVNQALCTFVLDAVARCNYNVSFDDFVSLESHLALNPDVLIFSNWEGSLTDEELLAVVAENPLWGELTAVRNGRVIIPKNYSNPNLASFPDAEKFLDRFMPLIYPEIFPDGPLTDAEVREIVAES